MTESYVYRTDLMAGWGGVGLGRAERVSVLYPSLPPCLSLSLWCLRDKSTDRRTAMSIAAHSLIAMHRSRIFALFVRTCVCLYGMDTRMDGRVTRAGHAGRQESLSYSITDEGIFHTPRTPTRARERESWRDGSKAERCVLPSVRPASQPAGLHAHLQAIHSCKGGWDVYSGVGRGES